MYASPPDSLTAVDITNITTQIVDATHYDPATADEGIYRKIVLGAFDKKQDEKGSADTQQADNEPRTSSRVEIGQSASRKY